VFTDEFCDRTAREGKRKEVSGIGSRMPYAATNNEGVSHQSMNI
jgi:hypothetical protein